MSDNRSDHEATVFDPDRFKELINREGFCVVEGVLTPDFIARVKAELEVAIAGEVDYHGTRDYADYGMVLLCSLYGGAFNEIFDLQRIIEPFEAVLGEACVVYSYTSSSLPPAGRNFSSRIHRDCRRIIPGYLTNMGVTLLLDDFTEENGATWYLPRSHRSGEPPESSDFYASARRLVAAAGSAFFFDANLWHAGGENRTSEWRHALTINMCRGFMKQRIDIPRAMRKIDVGHLSEQARQKLGFYAQVPTSYDEYYAPPEARLFRQQLD